MRLSLFITVLSSIFFLQVATAKESTLNGKQTVIDLDQSIEAMVDVQPIVRVVEPTPKKAGPIVKAFMQNVYTDQYFTDSVLAAYFRAFYDGYNMQDYAFAEECQDSGE